MRVVNLGERFPTLGEKYNAAVRLVGGELIAPWEDDDISLPHRLSLSVARLGRADYFNPRAYWFWSGRQLGHEQLTGYAHCASIFRRSAWDLVGGYPADCKQDAGMDGRLRASAAAGRLRVVDGPLSAAESFYVYRWGVSDHHVSAFADPEAAYRDYGGRLVARGRFTVIPAWRAEYARLRSAP